MAQIGALAALEDDDHIRRSRELNNEGKSWLYRELCNLGLEYVPTETNFIFFNLEQDSQVVYEKLLSQGVIARGGAVFGCPTWLRVTVGTKEQNSRFIKALKKALDR